LIRIPEKYVCERAKEMFGNETNINLKELIANEIANADDIGIKEFYAKNDVGYRLDDCLMYDDGYFYRSASNEASPSGYAINYYWNPNGVKEDVWYDASNHFLNYLKAEQVGEDIVIYDNYAHCSGCDGVASKTSNDVENNLFDITFDEYDSLMLNNKWTEQLKQKAGKYKHTFKKDSSGNYYWYASEMID